MKELKEAFDGESKTNTKKDRLMLSAAVPASFEAINAGYDVPEINKYLDMINVMTYDFHGDWEQIVGHNSPLFPLNAANMYHKKLTVVSIHKLYVCIYDCHICHIYSICQCSYVNMFIICLSGF